MAIDSAVKRLALLGAVAPLPDGSLDAVERLGMMTPLYIASEGPPPEPSEPVERTLRGMLITIGRGMSA